MSGTAGFVVDTVHSIADSVQPGAWAAAVAGTGEVDRPGHGESLRDAAHALRERHPRRGRRRHPAVPRREQRVLVRQGADGADGHLVLSSTPPWTASPPPSTAPACPKDTPKITIVPIQFPDVAGKGNPSTMFADPDAGHAVNAKSKNRNAAITFALWMGGTKEGQQIVVNNMDSFATLNGVIAAVGHDQAGQPRGAAAPARRGHQQASVAAKDARSLGLSAELSQAIIDASQAMVNGEQVPGRRRGRHPGRGRRDEASEAPHPARPVTPSRPGGRRDHHDDRSEDPATATAQRSPRRSSGLHRPPGLPWILPAMVVSVGLLYYCIGYTGYISTLDGMARLRCGRTSDSPTTPGWSPTRCSGGLSPTPWCSSW